MEQLVQDPKFITIIILLALWTLPWKGYALWLAAKKGQKAWFVVLLLVNTLAILEILYIFVFSKEKKNEVKVEEKKEENNPEIK